MPNFILIQKFINFYNFFFLNILTNNNNDNKWKELDMITNLFNK